MTPPSSIVGRLSHIFRAVFDDEAINIRDDMTSNDIAEWDSLTHIDLIYSIEKEFKIVFTTGEAGSSLKNVGELRALIERKIDAHDG